MNSINVYAKKKNKIISFDPNLRPPLWESEDLAAKQIWYGIEQCDILKIADNEIQWSSMSLYGFR